MSISTRLLRQVVLNDRRNKGRFILLAISIAISLTAFLSVEALARASSQNLDSAIETDSGATGTYLVEIHDTLGLDGRTITAEVRAATADLRSRPMLVADILPETRPTCPPYKDAGTPVIAVLRDESYVPLPLNFGSGIPIGTRLCLDGVAVPGDALYKPSEGERTIWGNDKLFVIERYEALVSLASSSPRAWWFVVVTGSRAEMRDIVQDAIATRLEQRIAHQATTRSETLAVSRVDADATIRAAADAAQIVYRIIAWAILLLGALGVLIAQLVTLRDRKWFFGLARAVGAAPRHIASLVLIDVALTVASGVALSLVLLATTRTAIGTFTTQAFGTELALLDAEAWPGLAGGIVAVLCVGGIYPGWKAVKLDPVAVLERA